MLRYDWTLQEIRTIHDQPFPDLIYHAQKIHRTYFKKPEIQRSTLLSLKTGGCSEDCAYCSQSIHNDAEIETHNLLPKDHVIDKALAAKESGSTRFCMSVSGREVKDGKEFDYILDLIKDVAALDLEVCVTLGMLNPQQAKRLKEAGCSFYNHNLDTSPEYYEKIITTRTYEERLRTLENIQQAGISLCSGGILGMGEQVDDRLSLLLQLANLEPHPVSVPINMLVRIQGTPLEEAQPIDPFDFVRVIACARIVMPASMLRLAAGRKEMSAETQALCFLAGANSIFAGSRLLTTPNPGDDHDSHLLNRLGMSFAATIE